MTDSRSRILKNEKWLPDFLGIGAQRSGTTWLYHNLRQHPEIWMPPIKELQYFNRLYPGAPSPLTSDSLPTRFFSRGNQNRLWRRELVRMLLNIRRTSWQEFIWYTRFFLGRYNDEWYASLFKGKDGLVKGEITPAYSILEARDVEHIKAIMPEVKIIYILRNPIHRAWSAVRGAIRHQVRKLRISRDEQDRQMMETFSSPQKLEQAFHQITNWEAHQLRGDYVRTLNNWGHCFPENRFFVGFFEQITQDPEGLLSSVFEFLGVDSSRAHITQVAYEKINPTPMREIPPALEHILAERYYPQIKVLSEIFKGHATDWLRYAEMILQEGT